MLVRRAHSSFVSKGMEHFVARSPAVWLRRTVPSVCAHRVALRVALNVARKKRKARIVSTPQAVQGGLYAR